jgi:hypothetical protein
MNEADLLLLKAERLRQEISAENRRFIWQIIVALAIAFAAGVLIGKL